MKKLLFWAVVFAITLASCSEDEDFTRNQTVTKSVEAIDEKVNIEGQNEANRINNIILGGMRISTRTGIDGNSISVYPTYYGGSFIEKDGTLKIFIKGDSLSVVKKIKAIYNDKIVHFSVGKYSYNELCNVIEDISSALKNADVSIRKNISMFGTSEEQNRVVVYLLDCSKSSIEKFKQVYNHPSLVFKQLGRIIEEKGVIYPGNKLYRTTYLENSEYGSFAFRAREKFGAKRVGYVTAGHVLEVGDFCFVKGVTVGECVKKAPLGGKADAAFVVVNENNFDLSNYVNGNTNNPLSIVTSQPGEGTYVNKWGATTGNSGGYIKNINAKVEDSEGNIKFVNMTSVDYRSDGGDSGGVVYSLVKSTNTRYTVGVHYGRSIDDKVAIFSKADNVLNSLNLERY